MGKGFTRFKFTFVIFAVLCFSRSAAADDSSPALAYAKQKAKNSSKQIANQVASVANTLLINARPVISKYFLTIQDLNLSKSQIEDVERSLNTNLVQYQQTYNELQKDLRAAIFTLFGIETKILITPSLIQLNKDLLGFVQRYRVQADIPGATYPDSYVRPILGDVLYGLRPAMGEIIDAEADDLEHIANIISSSADFLTNLQHEMESITLNLQAPYPALGLDHYRSTVLIRLEAQREVLRKVSMFLGGLNVNGQSEEPAVCDYSDRQLQSLSSELFDIWDTSLDAKKYNGAGGFAEELTKYDVTWYDGDPQTFGPGMISHWGSCIGTRQAIAEDFRLKLEAARSENRLELAREIDLNRQSYLADINQYQAELLSIRHRRKIVVERLMNAASIQTRRDPTERDTLPWHLTVQAFSLNIIQEEGLYPPIMKAALSVIDSARKELTSNYDSSTIETQRAWFISTAEKIRSINENGLQRLATQIRTSVSSMRVMATNIRSGEYGLVNAINAYETVSFLKLRDIQREHDSELPNQLTLAQTDKNNKQASFDLVGSQLEVTIKNLSVLQTLKAQYAAGVEYIQLRLANPQFASVYQQLIDTLVQDIRSNKSLASQQASIDAKLRETFSSFVLIDQALTPAPPIVANKKKVCKIKNKKRVCRLVKVVNSNKVLAQLESKRDAMANDINTSVDNASRPFLENQTISEITQSLQETLKQILSLK